MPHAATVVGLGLGLLLAACPHGGDGSPQTPEPPPTKEDLEWKMKEHFDAVARIKEAVVVGELATVSEQALALAETEDPQSYPLDWRPHVVELLSHTDGLAHAKTVQQAASGAAHLAGACGGCHTAIGARPEFGDAMEPSEDDDVRARMERHQWAVDRMWEGIVGPSDEAWTQGASVFVGAPGCEGDFPEGEAGERKRLLCESVANLGRQAAGTPPGPERVTVYGDFLATCSGCHSTES